MITVGATYQQTKTLVDSVNGTYQTVLTIDPSLDQRSIEGTYSCTVENDRGESSETVVVSLSTSPSLAPIEQPEIKNTALSVGLSFGVLFMALISTVVIITCVQKSRKKGAIVQMLKKKRTIPTDTYDVSKDTYEIMDLPQLPPSSNLNQNHEYGGIIPPQLPSHPDTISTDLNAACTNSIQTQPNAAYNSVNFDVS